MSALHKIWPKPDASSGFVVGGVNATSLIQNMTEYGGLRIEYVEQRMLHDYLAAGERVAPIMAADNQLVVDTWGTTHQALVAPLLRIIAAVEAGLVGGEVTLNGVTYRLENSYAIRGMVRSPFDVDVHLSNKGAVIVRADTGQKLTVAYAQIELIARYGFYGSLQNLDRRIDPVVLRQFVAP